MLPYLAELLTVALIQFRVMPAARRFPPLWTIEEANNACFIVRDSTGHAQRPSCSPRTRPVGWRRTFAKLPEAAAGPISADLQPTVGGRDRERVGSDRSRPPVRSVGKAKHSLNIAIRAVLRQKPKPRVCVVENARDLEATMRGPPECDNLSRNTPNDVRAAQEVDCPRCGWKFAFHRSQAFRIDSLGLESYSFECRNCGVSLAAIVDPFDEALLLSERAAEATP